MNFSLIFVLFAKKIYMELVLIFFVFRFFFFCHISMSQEVNLKMMAKNFCGTTI